MFDRIKNSQKVTKSVNLDKVYKVFFLFSDEIANKRT